MSGHDIGILLNNGVHGATLLNDYIGTDITGTLPIPNIVAVLLSPNTRGQMAVFITKTSICNDTVRRPAGEPELQLISSRFSRSRQEVVR